MQIVLAIILVLSQRRLSDRKRLSNVADAKSAAATGATTQSFCNCTHNEAPHLRYVAHPAWPRSSQVDALPLHSHTTKYHTAFLCFMCSCPLFAGMESFHGNSEIFKPLHRAKRGMQCAACTGVGALQNEASAACVAYMTLHLSLVG